MLSFVTGFNISGEKQVLFLLAQENKPVNLLTLTEKSQISAGDLLNILPSLTRRVLIENQDNFYQLIPILRAYLIKIV